MIAIIPFCELLFDAFPSHYTRNGFRLILFSFPSLRLFFHLFLSSSFLSPFTLIVFSLLFSQHALASLSPFSLLLLNSTSLSPLLPLTFPSLSSLLPLTFPSPSLTLMLQSKIWWQEHRRLINPFWVIL